MPERRAAPMFGGWCWPSGLRSTTGSTSALFVAQGPGRWRRSSEAKPTLRARPRHEPSMLWLGAEFRFWGRARATFMQDPGGTRGQTVTIRFSYLVGMDQNLPVSIRGVCGQGEEMATVGADCGGQRNTFGNRWSEFTGLQVPFAVRWLSVDGSTEGCTR